MANCKRGINVDGMNSGLNNARKLKFRFNAHLTAINKRNQYCHA